MGAVGQVLASLGVLFISSGAWAEESGSDAALQHRMAGLSAYSAGRYEEAVRELRRAFALGHAPAVLLEMARAHERLGDDKSAAEGYQRYLDTAPNPADAADAATVRIALEAARTRLKSAAQAATPPVVTTVTPQRPAAEQEVAPADPCADRRVPRARKGDSPAGIEWAHDPIDAAVAGQPIAVHVQAPVSAEVKLRLHYRTAGETDFTAVEMRRHGMDKVAQIPAAAVQGRSLHYYIEARHQVSGALLYASGSLQSPNVVYLSAEGEEHEESAPVEVSSE